MAGFRKQARAVGRRQASKVDDDRHAVSSALLVGKRTTVWLHPRDQPPVLGAELGLAGDVDAEPAAPGLRDDVGDAVLNGQPLADMDLTEPLDLLVSIAGVDIGRRQRNVVPQPTRLARS